jgi:uncharacterized protein HemY
LLGLIAWRSKDFARAEQMFEGVHREAPAHLEASNLLAMSIAAGAESSKLGRAQQLAENNVRQNPRSASGYVALGQVYVAQQRYAQATEALRLASTTGQLSSDAAYLLAVALARQQQSDEARRLMEKALAARGVFVFRQECQRALDELPAKPAAIAQP